MRQYSPKQLTVPAGTLASAPAGVIWRPYPAFVHAFRIDIPTGHNGLTGVRLTWHGTPVVPFDLAAFLIGSGGSHNVPFGEELDDSGLLIQGFNTDVWDHTFYLYADVDPYHRARALPGLTTPRTAPVLASSAAAIGNLARTGGE